MTNLDSIFKSRDITLSTKVCLVKVMVFPVVMYGCESWTIKKAEISCLSVVSFAIIFSHSEGCLFTLLIFPFVVQKLLILIRSHLLIFFFYFQYSGRWIIEDPAVIYVRECFAYILL